LKNLIEGLIRQLFAARGLFFLPFVRKAFRRCRDKAPLFIRSVFAFFGTHAASRFPQKSGQKTPRLDLLLRPVVPQRAYRRISYAGLKGVRRVPAGLPAVGRRAAVRDYPRSRDGLGGVRQLPAAGPSHSDNRPPQVRTRVSGFKERSGGMGGKGRLKYAPDGRQRAATEAAKP